MKKDTHRTSKPRGHDDRRRSRIAFSAVALASVFLAGFAQPQHSRTTGSDAMSTVQPQDQKPLMRGERYCEVMIVRKNGRKLEAEVWSTQGVSPCPDDCVKAFDTGDIKSETGAQRVTVNGPKVWLPNSPAPTPEAGSRRRFGGIELGLMTTLEVDRSSRQPYTERALPRTTSNTFTRGAEIYELTSPDGDAYVMHSMSLSEDPTLAIDQLATLEPKLKLPRGWTYRARVLDEDLILGPREGEVVVLQDRLKNTYQKL